MGKYDGSIRRQVEAALRAGGQDSVIASAVGASRQYVGQVRSQLGMAPSVRPAATRDTILAILARPEFTLDADIAREVGCAVDYVKQVRARAEADERKARPRKPAPLAPIPRGVDGPVDHHVVKLNGGEMRIGPASEGRALLTMREGSHVVVVRVDRLHLDAVIERLTAARDRLPVVEVHAQEDGDV